MSLDAGSAAIDRHLADLEEANQADAHLEENCQLLAYQSQFDGCRTWDELEDAVALGNLLDHILHRMPHYPPHPGGCP